MKSEHLNTFTIDAQQAATHVVIWMHGLGATAHDFEELVPMMALDPSLQVRFVFPQAPVKPITINQGMAMPAWYDIYHLDRLDQQDRPGIENSAQSITQLIELEIARGVPSENIVLAGFSQGGAMALHTGLRFHQRLAGIFALSCYLPLADLLDAQKHHSNQNTPIFMAHGSHDPVLPLILAELGAAELEKCGYPVEWHSYAMEHQICPEEIRDLSLWLNKTFRAY
jgi:phospholipase/carboxylesterase